jgi:hypothetical protein
MCEFLKRAIAHRESSAIARDLRILSFLGISSESEVPDSRAIWLFDKRLTQGALIEERKCDRLITTLIFSLEKIG